MILPGLLSFYEHPPSAAAILPCGHDREDLFFVITLVILAPSAAENVALSATLRGGILPDMVLQTPMDEGDASAVILLGVLEGHGAKGHEFTDLF